MKRIGVWLRTRVRGDVVLRCATCFSMHVVTRAQAVEIIANLHCEVEVLGPLAAQGPDTYIDTPEPTCVLDWLGKEC